MSPDPKNFEQLERELQDAVAAANDLVSLEDVRVTALGKKGRISELMKGLGALPPEQRKDFGQAVNGLKERISEALGARKQALHAAELDARLGSEQADITLSPRAGPLGEGRIHPVSQVMDEITEIFADTGFNAFKAPCVKGIRVPGAGDTSRNRPIDTVQEIIDQVKKLSWI